MKYRKLDYNIIFMCYFLHRLITKFDYGFSASPESLMSDLYETFLKSTGEKCMLNEPKLQQYKDWATQLRLRDWENARSSDLKSAWEYAYKCSDNLYT